MHFITRHVIGICENQGISLENKMWGQENTAVGSEEEVKKEIRQARVFAGRSHQNDETAHEEHLRHRSDGLSSEG
ncbi:hypothetical protein J6TS7_37090 [Paenibacillus dendritiformis]|nr:hypothetical protein J6TS7_37090 [Paenibacillus dendritiformis]